MDKKTGENNPNVYFGLTDHPLDVDASAFFSLFTILRKMRRKKASCVLQITFKEQISNSFIFDARGFDVYKIRDLDFEFAHNYKITNKTPYKDLLLQIDMLKDDSYRLRLTGETSVPENETPMIVGDIRDPRIKAGFTELEECYVLTTEKITLEIYKEDFCIQVYDKAGNLITETGGKTKNEFPTTMDSLPLGFAKDKKHPETYSVESFVLYPGERIYGLGEGFGPLDKTGKTSVPPKWSFGTWMSRISYFSRKEVLETAVKLRKMKIPCDVIHIDTGWFEKDWQCDWEFDKERFPDPEGMFRKAGEMGFRLSLWQAPYVMDETKLYKEAKKKKVLAKNHAPFNFQKETQDIVRRILNLRYKLIPYIYSESHIAASAGLPLLHSGQ